MREDSVPVARLNRFAEFEEAIAGPLGFDLYNQRKAIRLELEIRTRYCLLLAMAVLRMNSGRKTTDNEQPIGQQ